jgi:ribonucleoside-diphosphate reductase alpha chain
MPRTNTKSEKSAKALKRVPLTPNALQVLKKRQYLLCDEKGQPKETPEEMFYRVAKFIAQGDKKYRANAAQIKKTTEEFYEIMANLEFLSGMALRNAGRRELGQLSACYVLPVSDSMESIFSTLKNAAFLHKSGAGVGYDFSELRPQGDVVKSTGGRTSGPISFMKLYDYTTETVVNNASARRGGNMGILRVDHPDILNFIKAKEDEKALNNFNISVAVTDKFMKAVQNDTTYDLINPRTKKPAKELKARDVFNLIVEQAWKSAEPGLLFIDTVNKFNQTPQLGRICATNLCGEQPLLAYEACNLGSIVLTKMLKEINGRNEIDYQKLEKIINIAVHFLDNTVDLNNYPFPQIREINLGNRKIGLGVMGFADMLYELEIPYNSDKAEELSEKLMKFISETARRASMNLAKSRSNFPNFKKSVWLRRGFKRLRNATVTTIAPTGTISIFANCSSGIEPVFGLAFVRKNILEIGKTQQIEINPIFEKKAKENWFYSRELMEKIAKTGSAQNIPEIPKNLQKVFITAQDIEPEWHIKLQSVFQKYTDNAVSKTVNLKNSATKKDVAKVFTLAYKLGCKGVTVYRDKCRERQVLNLSIEDVKS